MSKSVKNATKNNVLSPKVIEEIEVWLKKFPVNQRQSALLAALRFAQEDNSGSLTNDIIEAVADYIGVPDIAAFEVATFYSMYDLEPVGKHKITVCGNISCKLCDCDGIIKYLENKLDIKVGQTTEDRRFTLKKVECLGACVDAPVMQVDDRDYHGKLTPEKIDVILKQLQEASDGE